MDVLAPLRFVNRYVKAAAKAKMGRTLSTVRRIERVYPPPGRLVVAMTFDDGPTAALAMGGPESSGGSKGLTASLLDTMKKFGARGTFDVIGSTASNYPDKEGRIGTALWSGVKYDHYPMFGQDSLAGAVNQKALARRMLDEGHELSNHGHTHIDFGPSRIVYGSRGHFRDTGEVLGDLKTLHDYIRSEVGYEMRLGRPAHYIDRIPGGKSAYDVYGAMRYNYLGASFDGGGWKVSSGDYARDVQVMVDAVKRELEKDPAFFNGQIIFQKDGYNMSKESPIVDALPLQLEILRNYGYSVVTVSELMDMSPFTDVPASAPYFGAAKALSSAGYRVAFRDNSFKPERPVTPGELAALLEGPWPEKVAGQGAAVSALGLRGNTVTAGEAARALVWRLEADRGRPAASSTEHPASNGSDGMASASIRRLLSVLLAEVAPDEPLSRGWTAAMAAAAFDLDPGRPARMC